MSLFLGRGTCLLGSLSAAALGMAGVPGASAQQTGGSAAESSAISGDGQSPIKLEEITVTASKRSATVLETPISITAISGSDIQARSGGDFNSLVQTVPGLATFDQGPGQTQLTIRGVDGSAGSSPTTGFYLGDTPLTAPAGANDGKVVIDPALYDLDRVEVLRGPQGTLYGASSMGGTVRLIPNNPKLSTFDASAQAIASGTVGGGPNGTVNGMLNLPMGDKVALRVVGTQAHTSGWIDRVVIAPGAFPAETNGNTVRGNVLGAPVAKVYEDANYENLTSARVSLLAKPIDDLTITPAVVYQHIGMGAPNIYDSVPGTLAHYQPYDIAEPYSDRFLLESINVDYKSPWFDVVSNTSYWDRESKQTRDDTEPVATLFNPTTTVYGIGPDSFTATDETRQFSQEVRLASIGDTRFRWIVGGFYSHFQSIGINTGGGDGLVTNTGPTSTGQNYTSPILFSKYIPIELQQQAAFGEISYELIPGLRATFGGRYFEYSAKETNYSDGDFRGNVATVAPLPTARSSGFNPKYDVSYHPNADLTVYATAAEGFRPGGGNQTPPNVGAQAQKCQSDLAALGLAAQPTQYDPDSLWSYELGEKARFFDGRVSVNADAYIEKWTRLQQTVTLACGTDFTANVGAASIPGGELEVAALVADGLQVSLSLGYSHGRLTEGTPQAGTVVGERILDVPDFTSHAGISYTRPLSDDLSLVSSVDFNYVSNRVESDRGLLIQMPAHSLTNLRVGVRREHWDAALFANNVLNSHIRLGVTGNEIEVIPAFQNIVSNQPLTLGVDASYHFR